MNITVVKEYGEKISGIIATETKGISLQSKISAIKKRRVIL